MSQKPNKWIAVILTFLIQPIGLMYVGRARLGIFYLLAVLGLFISGFVFQEIGELSLLLMYVVAIVSMIHAYRVAANFPSDASRPKYTRWYALLGASVGLFVLVIGFRSFGYEPFRAPSSSMEPTIPLKSRFLVQKWGYGHYNSSGMTLYRGARTTELQRGDIIVFDFPKDSSIQYVKRLIGLPGDQIMYKKDQLFVNHQLITKRRGKDVLSKDGPLSFTATFIESFGTEYQVLGDRNSSGMYLSNYEAGYRDKCNIADETLNCFVPKGHYFVMGDNRGNSNDSRYWGFVPETNIVGKVVYIGR
jgi:signal peptidase I